MDDKAQLLEYWRTRAEVYRAATERAEQRAEELGEEIGQARAVIQSLRSRLAELEGIAS